MKHLILQSTAAAAAAMALVAMVMTRLDIHWDRTMTTRYYSRLNQINVITAEVSGSKSTYSWR